MAWGHVTNRLAGYLEGALSPAESRRVERHLETCDVCRSELEKLRAASYVLKAAAPRVPAADDLGLWSRVRRELTAQPTPRRSVWRPALAPVAVVATAVFIFYANPFRTPVQETRVEHKPASAVPDTAEPQGLRDHTKPKGAAPPAGNLIVSSPKAEADKKPAVQPKTEFQRDETIQVTAGKPSVPAITVPAPAVGAPISGEKVTPPTAARLTRATAPAPAPAAAPAPTGSFKAAEPSTESKPLVGAAGTSGGKVALDRMTDLAPNQSPGGALGFQAGIGQETNREDLRDLEAVASYYNFDSDADRQRAVRPMAKVSTTLGVEHTLFASPSQPLSPAEKKRARHILAGDERFEAGDNDGALKEYRSALAIRPDADVWFKLGSVYERANAVSQAVDAYQNSLKLAPRDKETATVLERLSNQGK